MSYPKILKHIVRSVWFAGAAYLMLCILGKQFGWFEAASVYTDPYVVVYYFLFLISGILTMTIGKSKEAHYICPFSPWILTGIRLGEKLRIPSLTIVTDANQCVKCKQCSRACIINQDVCQKVKDHSFDQTECMNCYECVAACKTGAIKREWRR